MQLHSDLSLKYLLRNSAHKNSKLMLLLHGYGSNEADLFSFAEEIPEEFTVVSLRAPRLLPFGGFSWYDIDFYDARKFNNVEQAENSIQLIRGFIDEFCEKHSIKNENIWLCGFSQGAILSNALTIQNPKNIARVIMLSGYWAKDIIGDILPQDFSNLKYFISHGSEDAVIPVEWARETEPQLQKLKIENTYKEYRSGHGIVPQNFYDMMDWIKNNL